MWPETLSELPVYRFSPCVSVVSLPIFLKTTLFLFCVSLQVEGGGESEGVRNKALEVNIFQMA